MIKEGKFGVQEGVCLATIAISTKLFYSSPGYLSRLVGASGWYTTIFSDLIAFIAFSLILILFYLYPGKNMLEIFELVLGKWIGGLFSVIFSAFFLFSAGTLLREFLDIIKIYVLPESPLSIMIACVVLAVVLSSFFGLESIARAAKIIAPFIAICFVGVLLLCAPNYKTENLYPLLGYGIDKSLKYGALRCSVYDEVMILTVFARSLQGTKYLKKIGFLSLLISGVIISSGILCFSLAFPIHELQEISSPMFVLTRAISYGAFFQRLDPFLIFIWTFSSLISIAILFYSSAYCFSLTFRLPDTRPSIFPLSLLLYIVAMTPMDFLSVAEGSVQLFRVYGWCVMFLLPIITLITAGIKKMAGALDQSGASASKRGS